MKEPLRAFFAPSVAKKNGQLDNGPGGGYEPYYADFFLALSFLTVASVSHSQQILTVPTIIAKYCFSQGNVVATYYADHSYVATDGTGRELRATWQGAPGTGEVSIVKDGNEIRHDTYFMASGSLWLRNKPGGTFLAKSC